jgi:preprotein translocase subunit SecA
VDRQLAGRAARQGDPGSCRFFVSADDPLVLQHGWGLARHIKQAAFRDGEALADYSSEIDQTQRRAEQLRRLQRKQLFVSDDWLEEVLSKLLSPG